MSGKVILWRSAGARRADIRRICLTKPQADIAGEMRDAGCESKLQTANCKQQTANSKQQTANSKQQTANSKQDRSMSCVVPPSKRASIGQPNHSKRASRSESLSFAFSSLPVFPSSRLPVFTSSRLHVFTSSRFRDIETSRRSNRSRITRAIQLARSFAHIAHVAPLAPIAKPCPRPAAPRRPPGVAASRNALGCERPEAVAPRHAARTP